MVRLRFVDEEIGDDTTPPDGSARATSRPSVIRITSKTRGTDATILKVNFIFINERAAAAPAEKEGPR